MKTYQVKTIQSTIQASFKVPGSKSYTNRALIIAALAEGKSIITDALLSDDTRYAASALKELGVKIQQKGNTFTIEGTDGFSVCHSCESRNLKSIGNKIPAFAGMTKELYLGNAGTATRFLTAVMCLSQNFDTIITGNERMRERPISDLVDGLCQLGAHIEFQNNTDCPPLLVKGLGLKGGLCQIPGNKSSQYFSAIMIAAPYALSPVTIEVIGDLVSKPYIDITIEIMKDFGVEVINENYQKFTINNEQKYSSRSYQVEADASSASYPFAIAAAISSKITVSNAKYNSSQGDIKFVDILEKMGCSIVIPDSDLESKKGITIQGPAQLSPLGEINLKNMPDAAMTVAVLSALAPGKSILRGLENLRIKETDRLAALTNELNKCGAAVKELEDGLEINGNPIKLHGATIKTYDDHRMAMCFAVLGSKIPGIIIEDPDCVNKTYPSFWEDLDQIH